MNGWMVIDDCCGESDRGWGCAYRDVQMIVSNFILRGMSVKIPSILEIQQTLVDAAFVPATFLSSHSVRIPSLTLFPLACRRAL
jgi:hypothetical protein